MILIADRRSLAQDIQDARDAGSLLRRATGAHRADAG